MESAREQLKADNETVCTPWYLPTTDENIKMCDPWAAAKFNKKLDNIPKNKCAHCLPDCQATIYDASITALPFRRCDNKNMGVSKMCNFQSKVLSPPIFGSELHAEYDAIRSSRVAATGESADEIDLDYATKRYPSSARYFNQDETKELFSHSEKGKYDAYDKDIASVHFYFEKSTVFQFHRKNRMGPVDFASQVGGLLGLCLGFSICSGVEIVYWIFLRIWVRLKREPAQVEDSGEK